MAKICPVDECKHKKHMCIHDFAVVAVAVAILILILFYLL